MIDLKKIRKELIELQSIIYAGESIKAQLTATAHRLKKIQVNESLDTNRVENLLVRLEELTEETNKRIKKILTDKLIAEREIYLKVDSEEERTVLRYYYLSVKDNNRLLSIKDVADVTGYSIDRVKRLKKLGLSKLNT